MRTTLNLDEKLLAEVMRETGETDKGRAVNAALAEYVRREKIERLIALAGHIDYADDWKERHDLELELEESHRKPKAGA